jgi:hypothetical protein
VYPVDPLEPVMPVDPVNAPAMFNTAENHVPDPSVLPCNNVSGVKSLVNAVNVKLSDIPFK